MSAISDVVSLKLDYLILLTILTLYDKVGSLNESKIYQTMPCAILGENEQKIPCVQHLLIDKSFYCTTERLQELFPHLYEKQDTLKFPGKVPLLEPQYSNVTWQASPDGSIYFLKGFQVIQSGNDQNTFLKKQCAVLDLSNITEKQSSFLPKLKFSIDFRQPGGYSIQVEPLPPGSANNTESTILTQNPIFEVYHPKLDVTVNYKKINHTCVNITLILLPPITGADQIQIDTYYNGSWLQDLSGLVPYRVVNGSWLQDLPGDAPFKVVQYFPYCGLSLGNYTMEVSLTDDPSDDTQCTCYKGTPDLHTCTMCKTYRRTFYVTDYQTSFKFFTVSITHNVDIVKSSVADDNRVLTITMATLIPILATIAMASMLFIMFCRRNQNRTLHCSRNKEPDDMQPSTVYVLFSNDHEAHCNVVDSFIQLIESHFVCSVKASNFEHIQTSSEFIQLEDSRSRDTHKVYDVIIVIHSEYLHHLASEYELSQQHIDRKQPSDVCLIQEMKGIKINPSLSDKIISLYFNYTDKAFVNLLASEPLFYLPLQTQSMLRHLKSKLAFRDQKGNINVSESSKENSFISSIHRACEYQKYHPNWLTVKLFTMQQSYSSDDSGIIISNRRTKQRRSVRSKSADTVCKCEMSQPTSDCINCNKIRVRRHSFDHSFYPPETVSDDVSARLSLLEGRLVAVNYRYDFILGYTSNSYEHDRDYSSMGGESV